MYVCFSNSNLRSNSFNIFSIIKLKNLLSDDGALIFALPNPESYDAIKYKENWAGYDVPRHLWHFSKSSITTLVTNHGLNVVSIIPMKLDSYYVSLLSEKYIRGKNTLPGFVNAFLTGFKSNWKAHKTTNYSSLIYIVTK